jgi:hypothetical protein
MEEATELILSERKKVKDTIGRRLVARKDSDGDVYLVRQVYVEVNLDGKFEWLDTDTQLSLTKREFGDLVEARMEGDI